MMVNCMCHLDWTNGCPEDLVRHFSGCVCEGVSERGWQFLIGRPSKVDLPSPELIAFTRAGGPHPIHGGSKQNKKAKEGHICSPGLPRQHSWFSGFWDWNYTLGFSGPLACRWQVMGLDLAFIISRANSSNKSSICVYTEIYWT